MVVKATEYDARLESDGLAALSAAGVPVPQVLAVDAAELVLTEVGGPPDWDTLGVALSTCHRSTANAYGYHHANVLGPLSQDNTWTDSWSIFYAERRLEPYLADLPDPLADRIHVAVQTGALADLLEHGQSPSLVHGDLWSGNVVEGRWLIDPAVHYADRELDLAFAAVFGGLPERMWQAYHEAWPLDPGWERRRPALQLYHLLVHVRLFGAGYSAMVADRLDSLGW